MKKKTKAVINAEIRAKAKKAKEALKAKELKAKEALKQRNLDIIAKAEAKKLERLCSIYNKFVIKCGLTPTLKLLNKKGYTSAYINDNFGSMHKLYTHMAKQNPKIYERLINDSKFTNAKVKELKNKVKKTQRFILTTAVSGKEADIGFINSIKTFTKKAKAVAIVLPCIDVASSSSIFKYELDTRLGDFDFASQNIDLNKNIFISNITVGAKQINPLTGLDRIAQAKGSMVLASPKQYSKPIANCSSKSPQFLMTTGCVTKRDYSTDKSISRRQSYIADHDHVIGAIIVEIEDNKIFHFRQIQANKNGSFIDLGIQYNPNGTTSVIKESVAVFGDTHVGSHDLEVNEVLKSITKFVRCKEVILHDVWDNKFNNHHDKGRIGLRAKLKRANKTSLIGEGLLVQDFLNEWTELIKKITIIKSNHDEALDRYIDEGRGFDDEENVYEACALFRAKVEGKDILKYLMEEYMGLDNPKRINWLKRDESYQVYGIEKGAHGDKGANGSKGSQKGIEGSYYKATIGHSHSAGIFRTVFQVGTSTVMDLGYNSGPSSWTNTMCITYPNGSRQLINIITDSKGNKTWKL